MPDKKVANSRGWQHLLHTTWAGAVLLTIVALFLPMPFDLNGAVVSIIFCTICAFLVGILRTPCTIWLFQRVGAVPSDKRYTWLLLGTGSIFLLFDVAAAVLFTAVSYPNRVFSKEIWLWLRAFVGISLPWLVAALAAALYVNRDLLQKPVAA